MNASESTGRRQLTLITGGIGAGKSVVSRILRLRGVAVYDCDTEARRIMEESAEVASSLRLWFGEDVYDASGHLRRGWLAGRMFADAALLAKVNGLVHRLVREDIESHGVCFVETAIPVVSGLAAEADAIWLVDAPEELRLNRAVARGASAEDVLSRIETQRQEWSSLPSDRTSVIENSGILPLLPQIDSLLAETVL